MERFVGVFTRTDGYPVKPDPSLFLAAQKCVGIAPDDCIIVEDSENGTISAQRAGIPCIAIPNRMTAAADFSRAKMVLRNMRELLALISAD